jgi:hypothetical protein
VTGGELKRLAEEAGFRLISGTRLEGADARYKSLPNALWPPLQHILLDRFPQGPDDAEVTPSEFRHKLTDWWKHKSISDEEWRSWASGTNVKWVLAEILAGHP